MHFHFSKCPSSHPPNTASVYFRAWWVSSDLWERQGWQERRYVLALSWWIYCQMLHVLTRWLWGLNAVLMFFLGRSRGDGGSRTTWRKGIDGKSPWMSFNKEWHLRKCLNVSFLVALSFRKSQEMAVLNYTVCVIPMGIYWCVGLSQHNKNIPEGESRQISPHPHGWFRAMLSKQRFGTWQEAFSWKK